MSQGETIIEIDLKYFRPTEGDILLGDPTKARRKMGWEHEYAIKDSVEDMVSMDMEEFKASPVSKGD